MLSLYMPPTVRNIFIRASSVVKFALLPIGQLSEEGLEARNEDVRNFRLNSTRTFSRTKQIGIFFNDPLICSKYCCKSKEKDIYQKK